MESGTHNELMSLKEHYYSLVINQETSQMSDLSSDSLNLQLTKTKLIEKEEDDNKPANVSISLTTESKDEITKKVKLQLKI